MADLDSVSFIGSGVMAEAMIKALLARGLVEPAAIRASGPRVERAEELASSYGVKGITDNREAASSSRVVVLSVKPQVLSPILSEISGSLGPDALVLSIVAGARLSTIADALDHPAVARAMPNTPAQIGQGMTVWTASTKTPPDHRERAGAILDAMGKEHFVEDEGYLDMATALSGTGPTYVFLFMEALIDAGVHLGFSRRVAQELVLQTMEGSVAFARQSARHPAELRNMVTSPGGTSAEAIYQLDKGGVRTVLSRAIWAAYQKSRYLGGLSEQ
ncbi:MAG: pyrroline-5-carboxylate reductase [Anaerolineae bacterium]